MATLEKVGQFKMKTLITALHVKLMRERKRGIVSISLLLVEFTFSNSP